MKTLSKTEIYTLRKSRIELATTITLLAIALTITGAKALLAGISLELVHMLIPSVFVGVIVGFPLYLFLISRLDREFGLVTSWQSFVKHNLKFLLALFSPTLTLLLMGFSARKQITYLGQRFGFGKVYLFIRVIGFAYAVIIAGVIVPRLLIWLFKPTEIKDKNLTKRILDTGKQMGVSVDGVMRLRTPGIERVNAAQAGYVAGHRFVFLIGDWGKDFTEDEVVAVVGHELAHVKFRHLRKRILAYSLILLIPVILFLPDLIAPNLFSSLPLDWSLIIGVSGVIFIIVGMGAIYLWVFSISRRFEFQADRESATICGGEALSEALRKLAQKNLIPTGKSSLLNTHPSIQERLKRIEVYAQVKAQTSEEIHLPDLAE